MPTIVLRLPLFGKMALVKAPVDVAQRVSAEPPPEPQALPVPPITPEAMLRHPSAISLTVREPNVPDVEKRLVLEAVVAKKLVVVAEVVVELTAVKFRRVDEAVVIILVIVDTPPFESKDTLPSVLRIPLSSRYKEPAPI